MNNLIIAVVLLALLVAVVKTLAKRKARQAGQTTPPEKIPFKKNKYFLTNAERAFYRILKHVVGQHFEVFTQVRLLDLLWLPSQAQSKQKFKNMVQSKHADFVLCDPKTLIPLLVIELDDSSHQRADRQSGDAVKDTMLNVAGLPILRVKVQTTYNTKSLADDIRQKLGLPHTIPSITTAN